MAGVSLRSKFWKAFVPLFILQMGLMSALAHWFPDSPHFHHLDEAQTARLEQRLAFDGVATIITLCLGYAGFVHVFISESRRHIRASAEKAVLEAEMAAAREVQQVIVPEQGGSFPGLHCGVCLSAGAAGGRRFLPDSSSGRRWPARRGRRRGRKGPSGCHAGIHAGRFHSHRG